MTGPGAGEAPNVKVFSGLDASVLKSYLAFTPSFLGGVRVATGKVDGDAVPDLIAGAGPGGGPTVSLRARPTPPW